MKRTNGRAFLNAEDEENAESGGDFLLLSVL
jgi:hypothetical protein